MSTYSQFFLTIIVGVTISIVVWVSCSVFFSSSGIISGPFGPLSEPVSKTFTHGLVIGLFHGLLTGLIIFWYKQDSMISTSIASVVATEILLIIAFLIGSVINYLKQPIGTGISTTPTYLYVLHAIGVIFVWFVVLSIIFLIPSIIIGLFNKFLLNFIITSK